VAARRVRVGASGTEKYDPTLTPEEQKATNEWPEFGKPLAGQGAVVMVRGIGSR